VTYGAYLVLTSRNLGSLFKSGLTAALIVGAILVSPFGARLVKAIPFLGGTVEGNTITYRQELFSRSLDMIGEHPIFGNPDAYGRLNDLRQGFGLIDFVNSYAQIAIFYGLVGLALFVGFILWGSGALFRVARRMRAMDRDQALLGFAILACILGALVMMVSASFQFAIETGYYVLAALALAYARSVPRPSGSVSNRQR